MAHNKSSHLHRWRLALFLLGAVLIFGTTYVLYAGLNTLRRLDVVEAERDTWQRPADVLHALDLREGSVVVDLGAGAGYFALKLSAAVGSRGEVLAVDIRKLSLSFLWIRAALRTPHNIHIIIGEDFNPHLPTEAVDAVLIANTYHEFRSPQVMLGHAFRSLRPGGRLVIADRGPQELASQIQDRHQIPLYAVVEELRTRGSEIVRMENRLSTGQAMIRGGSSLRASPR